MFICKANFKHFKQYFFITKNAFEMFKPDLNIILDLQGTCGKKNPSLEKTDAWNVVSDFC